MPVPEVAGKESPDVLVTKEPYVNSMKKMHALLRQLQKFEEDYRLDPQRISDKAFAVLKNYFSVVPSVLSPEALIGTYGSIIYHDPVDLDADLVIMLPNLPEKQRQLSFVRVQSMLGNLQSLWPVQPFHSDIFLVSMEEIKNNASKYKPANISKKIDIASQATHVLTSKLLFDDMSDVVKHSLYQGEIFGLARAHPQFRQGILSHISKVLAIRKERRAVYGRRDR